MCGAAVIAACAMDRKEGSRGEEDSPRRAVGLNPDRGDEGRRGGAIAQHEGQARQRNVTEVSSESRARREKLQRSIAIRSPCSSNGPACLSLIIKPIARTLAGSS